MTQNNDIKKEAAPEDRGALRVPSLEDWGNTLESGKRRPPLTEREAIFNEATVIL